MLTYISSVQGQEPISFGTLVDEMTDLNRLTFLPEQSYRVIQFSSYDRRSQVPGMKGWFSNSDGFGREPIPGFEELLSPPDSDGSGVGTYLICDVDGPGAILRLWTAGINGTIRLFLDDLEEPFYDGEAEEFFWSTASKISGLEGELTDPELYRQHDATYFPIPFSKKCRLEWTGDIKKIHFYHVGIRLYDKDVEVETFQAGDITKNAGRLKNLRNNFFSEEENLKQLSDDADRIEITVPGGESRDLIKKEGSQAIDFFSIKVNATNLELALRSSILKMYFDDAEIPQVEAPVGDFFGAAPGLDPYESYPLSVHADGSMICRFVMPFQRSVRVVIENLSDDTVEISTSVHFKDYKWMEGKSMYFRTRWKMDRELTASNSSILDIPYIVARGKGRIVGVAAFLYNPSEAVTSWGNWWGEGDEKIFIDDEAFPSFFGTGSEDYFNYSWSAEHYFSYPYCGQPRNDGPGNRGYVSNFRWHISDDLPFVTSIAFFMELWHHGVVPGFSYGRIIYAYALPGYRDDYMPVLKEDVNRIPYLNWKPIEYLGSSGYTFMQAEDILVNSSCTEIRDGNLWSEGKILLWKPENRGDKITFNIRREEEGKSIIGMTLAHMPGGGNFIVLLNGVPVRFDKQENINLHDPARTYLKNHFSEQVQLKPGDNEIILKSISDTSGETMGIDFFWVRDKQH